MSELVKKIYKELDKVEDPELFIPITDLGLIYEVTEKNGHVHVLMTLTSLGCPLYGEIETDIRESIIKIDGIKDVDIELTFDPPWSPEKMSEEARADLGIEI